MKQEVDDEEDDDEADVNVDEQEEEEEEEDQEEENNDSIQSNNDKQDKKKESVSTEINDSRPRTRRAVAEASDKSNDHGNTPCGNNLYTRIRRSRRKNQTKPNSKY